MQDFFLSMTGQQENESIFPSLSFKERLIGFIICFLLGLIFQIMSMGSLVGVLLGRANKFAFLYTCGNIVSIFGTFFLVGPQRQFRNMSDPHRRNSSLIFLGSIVLTLISVYMFHSKIAYYSLCYCSILLLYLVYNVIYPIWEGLYCRYMQKSIWIYLIPFQRKILINTL